MVDDGFIQNSKLLIQNFAVCVRSVRFQEIMGCFNFGFWMMDFGLKTMLDFECWILDLIQNLEFKI
jgi:hypothetical protein